MRVSVCLVLPLGFFVLSLAPDCAWAFAPAPKKEDKGDPLPKGATARLGSVRLREAAEVNSVAFSPDGRTLLSGAGQGVAHVCLWDTATGLARSRLKVESGVVASAWSRDGKQIATATGLFTGGEVIVRIWDAEAGKELHRLDVKEGAYGLSFSPDGKRLAVNTAKKRVFLWQPAKAPTELEGHKGEGHEMTFSPDGKLLAGGATEWPRPDSYDGAYYVVRIWNVATGKVIHQLRGHEQSIRALAFSPDGKTLASGGRDENSVRLWDVATGKERTALPGRKGESRALWFSPKGDRLLSADGDGSVRGWQLPDGKALPKFPKLNRMPYSARVVAFSPDGKRLATGSWVGSAGRANSVCLWDLSDGSRLFRQPGHDGEVQSLAASADGKRLASCAADGVLLWDLGDRRVLRRFGSRDQWPGTIALSPDGATLAVNARYGEKIRLYDTANGKVLHTITWVPKQNRDVPDSEPASWLRFSPDGKSLAAVVPKKVLVWSLSSGREPKAEPRVLSVKGRDLIPGGFSRDGKAVLAGTEVGVIHWDVTNGKETSRLGKEVNVWQLKEHFRIAALAPDGKLLALGGDGALALWDTTTAKEIARLSPHSDDGKSINCIVFSPDGKTLASGDWSGVIRFWDIASRKELGKREGHVGGVRSLLFLKDGKTLASGGSDTTVLLWPVPARKE